MRRSTRARHGSSANCWRRSRSMPQAAAGRSSISATRARAVRRCASSNSSADGAAMIYFLAGCALLVLLLFAGRTFTVADPRKLAGMMRKAGGVAALAAAGFLLMRGALPLAIPLAVLGLSLIGRGNWLGVGGPFGSSRKTPGQTSDIRTDRLEMRLDHDSGRMDGTCLAGLFAGRTLSTLSDSEAMQLLDELQSQGAPEAALMEA